MKRHALDSITLTTRAGVPPCCCQLAEFQGELIRNPSKIKPGLRRGV
jgi:hypothetical protein